MGKQMNTPETSLELVQAWSRAINAETKDLVHRFQGYAIDLRTLAQAYQECWAEYLDLVQYTAKLKERFDRIEEGRDESHEILTLAGVPEFDENGGKRKVADRIMDLWKEKHPWLS